MLVISVSILVAGCIVILLSYVIYGLAIVGKSFAFLPDVHLLVFAFDILAHVTFLIEHLASQLVVTQQSHAAMALDSPLASVKQQAQVLGVKYPLISVRFRFYRCHTGEQFPDGLLLLVQPTYYFAKAVADVIHYLFFIHDVILSVPYSGESSGLELSGAKVIKIGIAGFILCIYYVMFFPEK